MFVDIGWVEPSHRWCEFGPDSSDLSVFHQMMLKFRSGRTCWQFNSETVVIGLSLVQTRVVSLVKLVTKRLELLFP